MPDSHEPVTGPDAIAVVGMAVRLPGAPNLDAFWSLLKHGEEAVRFFSTEELIEAGMDPGKARDSDMIAARGYLPDVDQFDANFFGISPREAALMDPQHRVMMEVAWHAMEHAGYDPDQWEGRTAVFTSTGMNTYLPFNLFTNAGLIEQVGGFQLSIYNDKDFVPTRIAYALNARGPAIDIGTACSSSLVGLHLACQSLSSFQCDAALVGGITIHLPQETGETPQLGSAYSPDGHCRPFDAAPSGLVDGNGAVAVVVKRLEDALADGDTIHGLVLSSAINNDGSDKVGYSAPSIDGQAEVILEAQTLAGIQADQISYIEAHGTATSLGDPIEIAGLTQAFRATTEKRQFCGVGSVKSNIGHVDKAAGLAGLVKTLLALKHECIPSTVHWRSPNPRLALESSPFYVVGEPAPWPREAGRPRIAGVSSFGVGGTNAHAIVAEAPTPVTAQAGNEPQLIVLSAKTQRALQAIVGDMQRFLEGSDRRLVDIAHSLQVGRRRLAVRASLVCDSCADLKAQLSHLPIDVASRETQSVVFMFSGQGTQYVGMGAALYHAYAEYRQAFDRCADHLAPLLGVDIRELLFAETATESVLGQTAMAQPALFAVEYALAQLLMSWGLRPVAVVGHSLGEYVACCIAGAIDLESALDLVASRGRLMQSMPGGSMLAVSLPEAQLAIAISELGVDVDIAAVNAESQCVLSGPDDAIGSARDHLVARGVIVRELDTSHAFHSRMMEPILTEFASQVAAVAWSPSDIPVISNVTGQILDEEQLVSADYWCRHMRQPVRFAQCLQTLAEFDESAIWLEVGPGRVLTGLAGMTRRDAGHAANLSTLPPAQGAAQSQTCLLRTVGKLWEKGIDVDWPALHAGYPVRRIPLPLYPFEWKRHWIEPGKGAADSFPAHRSANVANCCYVADWKLTPFSGPALDGVRAVLLWGDAHDPFVIELARAYEESGIHVSFDGHERDDIDMLVHWVPDVAQPAGTFEKVIDSLFDVARRARVESGGSSLRLVAVGRKLLPMPGDSAEPERATVLGLLRTLACEQAQVSSLVVDVPETDSARNRVRIARRVVAESLLDASRDAVVLRTGGRWVRDVSALPGQVTLGPGLIQPGGAYLVLGGASGIGLMVARALADAGAGELVLTQESGEATGDGSTSATDSPEPSGSLADGRCRVVIEAVAPDDPASLGRFLDTLTRIDGVVDASDFHRNKPFGLLGDIDKDRVLDFWRVQQARLALISNASARLGADFCTVMSSLAAQIGAPGQLPSAVYGLYLERLAQRENQTGCVPWSVIFWDKWSPSEADDTGISAALGEQFLERLFRLAEPTNVIISTSSPETRRQELLAFQRDSGQEDGYRDHQERPDLGTVYRAPVSSLEIQIAGIWGKFLGIEKIGVDDDFFALGGNSLLAAQLVSEINQLCGVELDLNSLFAASTVAQLGQSVLEKQLAGHDLDDVAAELERLESLSDSEVAALMSEGEASLPD